MKAKKGSAHVGISRTALSCDCHGETSHSYKTISSSGIRFPTSGSDNFDSDYQIFLKHLWVDGKPYVYKRKAQMRRPALYLKYETENHEKNSGKSEKPLSTSVGRQYSGSDRLKRKRSSSPISNRDIDSHLHPTRCKKNMSVPNQRHQTYSREAEADYEYVTFLKHLREDETSYVFEMLNGIDRAPILVKYERENHLRESGSCRNTNKSIERKGCYLDKTNASSVRSVPHHVPREEEGFSPDQSYQAFLEHVRPYHFSMILELDDGTSIMYEEGNKFSATKSPLLFHKYSKSHKNSYVDFSTCVFQQSHTSQKSLELQTSTYYQKRLADALAKPFDWNEYKDLSDAAKIRKPLQEGLHLRSRTKNYDTNIMSPSYLDCFPELAKKVEVADCQNRLTLLRGFFFWLKNLCHEGAYMPWSEKSSSYGSGYITLED